MTPHVLKRELIDIDDDVRAAPPPVVPVFEPPFSLRLVDPNGTDPEMLATWMSLPHLVDTWEQPWSAEQWRTDSAARLAGDYSRPCILSVDLSVFADNKGLTGSDEGMTEVAYVELYRAARDENATVYNAEPRDMGFHIATARTELLGRGVISTWMGLLADAIWSADPLCRSIIVDPDHRNTFMRRALVKKGWHELGEFDVRPDRRIALYSLIRPETSGD
jgi:RimJ/RimL family protein N-acetyltransferase